LKVSGLACLDMTNICRICRCKQTSMRKIIALVFEWRIYASFLTLCIWTYDAYMRHSAPMVLSIPLTKEYFTKLTLIHSTCSLNRQSELKLMHANTLTALPRFKNVTFRHHYVTQKEPLYWNWATLPLQRFSLQPAKFNVHKPT